MLNSSRENLKACEEAMRELLKKYIGDPHEKLLATLTNKQESFSAVVIQLTEDYN